MPKTKDIEAEVDKMDADSKKKNKAQEGEEGVEFASADAERITFDSSLIIQSEAFLKRWCPKYDKNDKLLKGQRMGPTVKDYRTIAELPVEDVWKQLALSGAGAFDPKLDEDPGRPV